MVILPPANQPPVISLADAAASTDHTLIPGQSLTLTINGDDADGDEMLMKMAPDDAKRYEGRFTFLPVNGRGQITSEFIWNPGCEQLSRLPEENEFTVRLLVYDIYCDASQADTLTLNLKLQDLEVNYEVEIANAFTPNGDSYSEEYFIKNLPADNCENQFESFTVYNRWGKQVYQALDRDFRWSGGGMSSGTYYYELKFTKKEYRGPIYIIF
jgi:gliding motility-associated-like protein